MLAPFVLLPGASVVIPRSRWIVLRALLAKGMDMNNAVGRWSEVAACYCLSATVVLVSVLQMARGQEELPPPAPKLSGANPNQILIDHRPRIVILTNVSPSVLANVPMLGQLFQNAGHGPTGCEEMLGRLEAANGQ